MPLPLSTRILPPYAQRGQALPLGLAFILAALLLTLVVFNTGEIAPEKAQVANTADAAVYSGLVWQARSLNFQAYTNRAMVANQVSIAQLVSLGSWTNYGRISARNLDIALKVFPPASVLTTPLLQIMTQIENVVQKAVKVAIPVIDGTTTVLSVVQEGVFNASYVATPEVVSTVTKANDQRYRSTSTYSIAAAVHNARSWQSLARRHSGEDDGMTRKADVIRASRDEFTADRGFDRVRPLPSRIYVPPNVRFSIVKEGTTQLVQDGADWEWRGKDGLSLHWETLGFSGWKKTELPMGWGSNYAEGEGACSGGACSGWFKKNGMAERFADAFAEDLGNGYHGVKAYRSLKNLSRENRDPRLQLRIEVEVANKDVRTAQKISKLGSPAPAANGLQHGLEPGMFYTEDAYASDSMASMSAGEVFFERPVLSEGDQLQVEGRAVEEYANLFNPYWDVRLINVSEKQRKIAWALRSPGLAAEATADVVANAATDAVTDLATDAATDIATTALSEHTNIDQGDLEQYTAIGEQAVSLLQNGAITDAIKGAALDAIKGAATDAIKGAASDALSNYVETNNLTDAFNTASDAYHTASDVFEDGEINWGDLDAAGDYLSGGELPVHVTDALSNYADANDFGDEFNTAISVLADGDINSDDLDAAGDYIADSELADQARDAASNYADTHGLGNEYNTASEVFADGDINSEDAGAVGDYIADGEQAQQAHDPQNKKSAQLPVYKEQTDQ